MEYRQAYLEGNRARGCVCQGRGKDRQELCQWLWNRSLLGRYGGGEQVHGKLPFICRELQDLVATNLGDASVRGMDYVGRLGVRSLPPTLQSVD